MMRLRWIRTALAAGVISGLATLASPAQAPDPATTGIDVGATAPRFKLKDQDGIERKLDDFLGKGKVALVFTRSADW